MSAKNDPNDAYSSGQGSGSHLGFGLAGRINVGVLSQGPVPCPLRPGMAGQAPPGDWAATTLAGTSPSLMGGSPRPSPAGRHGPPAGKWLSGVWLGQGTWVNIGRNVQANRVISLSVLNLIYVTAIQH